MLLQTSASPSSSNPAPATNLEQDDSFDIGLEEGGGNSAVLERRKRRQTLGVELAIKRFEQVRFRLARLGKSRSLHEVFERSRHFYFPQRLWIAFSVTNVGIIFFFAAYMYFIRFLCVALTSLRISFMNVLAQFNGFIAAAPTYLKLMMSNANSLQGLAGASHKRFTLVLALLFAASH